jgi:hypothetical protein
MDWLRSFFRPLVAWLARVTAVDVGKEGDGLVAMSSGTDVDKSWHDLQTDLNDAREAWRGNPMARRVVGLVTSHVVGAGISVSSEYGPLKKFIAAFWDHEQNKIGLRLAEWCNELTRSGELFPVLFTNEYDGMSYVRAIPASQIQKVEWRPGDYESELRYVEPHFPGDEDTAKSWFSPLGAPDDWTGPVMLHYAVNRPVGAVRGEGDLAPILTWLKRYNRWMEDRVRLNAAVRAFLWIVRAPRAVLSDLQARYKRPPEPGTVIVASKDEEWQAVAPSLQARDASADGRAIRWMIAAGGPGTSLVDFGEGEGTNLATAKATAEQRRRFLLQRQSYFCYMLADLIAQAFNRYTVVNGYKHRRVTANDVIVHRPDIGSEDNEALAGAVAELVKALFDLRELIGAGDQFRRFALRLFVKFSGESLSESEFEQLLADGS